MTDAFAWCHREDMDIRQVDMFDGSEVWAAYVEGTLVGAMSLWFPAGQPHQVLGRSGR